MSISQDVQFCCRLDDLLQATVEQEPVPSDGAVAEQQPLGVADAYAQYRCSELRQPQIGMAAAQLGSTEEVLPDYLPGKTTTLCPLVTFQISNPNSCQAKRFGFCPKK